MPQKRTKFERSWKFTTVIRAKLAAPGDGRTPALNLSLRLPFYSSKQMDSIIRSGDPRGFGIANFVPVDDLHPQQAVHSRPATLAAPCNDWS